MIFFLLFFSPDSFISNFSQHITTSHARTTHHSILCNNITSQHQMLLYHVITTSTVTTTHHNIAYQNNTSQHPGRQYHIIIPIVTLPRHNNASQHQMLLYHATTTHSLNISRQRTTTSIVFIPRHISTQHHLSQHHIRRVDRKHS